jgi:hypothetical protein
MPNPQFGGHKTPGGVFIHLSKTCEDISKEEMKKVLREQKKETKTFKRMENQFNNAMQI